MLLKNRFHTFAPIYLLITTNIEHPTGHNTQSLPKSRLWKTDALVPSFFCIIIKETKTFVLFESKFVSIHWISFLFPPQQATTFEPINNGIFNNCWRNKWTTTLLKLYMPKNEHSDRIIWFCCCCCDCCYVLLCWYNLLKW